MNTPVPTLNIAPGTSQTAMLPFNISILKLTDQSTAMMRPVTSLDIYDGATKNFHENGLFSISIFGRFGDDARDKMYSYIDIKTEVFHPLIYRTLCRLKGFYKSIMAGVEFAQWSDELSDFVPATALDGETGYSFFMRHWQKINFKSNKSIIRKTRIALIERFRDSATTNKILVIPAGLRDIEVGDDGRPRQAEINDHYRRAIGISNLVARTNAPNPDSINQARIGLQSVFNDIYDTFEKMVAGKKGFAQNKFASRRLFNGTQNVISVMDTSSKVMGTPNSIKITDTVVGLFQHLKAIEPVTIGLLRRSVIGKAFIGGNKALLINPKTLMPTYVTVSNKTLDQWTSEEGLGKTLNRFHEVSVRHDPVVIEDHYLALIYDDGLDFRIFQSIDELPEDRKRSYVRPITFCELIYLAGYREWNRYPAYVTRYPITSIGSIYPSTAYVKTTVVGDTKYELDNNWNRIGGDYMTFEYPRRSSLET